MDLSKVCRVCAETGVLLELFGSKTQSVSYAEDVNKCLSLEAAKGDGLPSHICVSCIGLINECLRFVNKLKNVGVKERRRSSESSRPKSCHFCESTENHLFPLSEAAVNKTNDCFSVKVSDKETICYRCQFCLDTVHDLKLKACASLKKFYSNSLSAKEEKTPVIKTESVDEIVSTLKNKFNMPKRIDLPKEVKVTIIDFVLVIGSDILTKGTINVNEYMQLIQPSSLKNGDISVGGKKKARQTTVKQANKQVVQEQISVKQANKQVPESSSSKPSGPSNPRPSPKRHQRVTFDLSVTNVSDFEVSTSTPSVSSKKKRTRITSDSEDDKPSKKSCTTTTSPNIPSSTTNSIADTPRQTRRRSLSSEKEDTPQESVELSRDSNKPVSKKMSPRPKSKKLSRKESSSTSSENTVEVDSPIVMDSSKENISDNSLVEEGDKTNKRKRGRKNDTNFSKFFGEASPPAKIQRKRRDSEEKDFFSSKGKKKQWKPSVSDSSDIDDPSSSMKDNPRVAQQPAFLKDLDDLLRYTPKSTFRPFICSVCREGYVSTVKGMLHKLVMHDPHSNILLKLTRCDADGELDKLKEASPFKFGSAASESSDTVVNDTIVNQTVVNDTVVNDEAAASDDELFPESRPKTNPVSTNVIDPFDSLVSSSSSQTFSQTRSEEPEKTASKHPDIDSCVGSTEAVCENTLDEDKTENESRSDLTSDAENNEIISTEDNERGEKKDDVDDDTKDETRKEELEEVQTQSNSDKSSGQSKDQILEGQSTTDEEKMAAENITGSVDHSENQDEISKDECHSQDEEVIEDDVEKEKGVKKDEVEKEKIAEEDDEVDKEKEVVEELEKETGVDEELETEVNERTGEEDKDVEKNNKIEEEKPAENVTELQNDTEKLKKVSTDDGEKASVDSAVENESASSSVSEEESSSEIPEAGLDSRKVECSNGGSMDTDEHKDSPAPVSHVGESINENHVEVNEDGKDNSEQEILHPEHDSLTETKERKNEDAHCEGAVVVVN